MHWILVNKKATVNEHNTTVMSRTQDQAYEGLPLKASSYWSAFCLIGLINENINHITTCWEENPPIKSLIPQISAFVAAVAEHIIPQYAE